MSHLSMRWLRGDGAEVGAGRHPVPLFGDAAVTQFDVDGGQAFGGRRQAAPFALGLASTAILPGPFDFTVASHVLEHTDSFLRALEMLFALTRKGGIVYVVLPDRDFLEDAEWMPDYDFAHHTAEYEDPLCARMEHDERVIAFEIAQEAAGAVRPDEAMRDQLGPQARRLPAAEFAHFLRASSHDGVRFMIHKHTYDFEGWLRLIIKATDFFPGQICIRDIRYGVRRRDCHFVLEKR